MTRLLVCADCLSVEPLPDAPRGVDPKHIEPGQDPLLDELLKRHRYPNGEAHFGNLVAVAEEDWKKEEVRDSILKEINDKANMGKGLGQDNYALRDTFVEDAAKCFAQHNRPQDGCIDWLSDSKKLGRPTREGQVWAKENYKAPTPFLCHFCPIGSVVMTKQRAAKGLYKE